MHRIITRHEAQELFPRAFKDDVYAEHADMVPVFHLCTDAAGTMQLSVDDMTPIGRRNSVWDPDDLCWRME